MLVRPGGLCTGGAVVIVTVSNHACFLNNLLIFVNLFLFCREGDDDESQDGKAPHGGMAGPFGHGGPGAGAGGPGAGGSSTVGG